MNFTKIFLFITVLGFQLNISAQYQGIYKVECTPAQATPCDYISLKITGYHDYANVNSVTITDTFYNDTIDILMYVTVPMIGFPALTSFLNNYTIGPFPKGNYTIITDYQQNVAQPSPTVADTTFIVDTLIYAYAGADSSFCDTNWVWIEANIPPTGTTGSWSWRRSSTHSCGNRRSIGTS